MQGIIRMQGKALLISGYFLSILGSLLITPLLLSISFFIVIFRGIISIHLFLKHRGSVSLISSMDSFQVFDKPNNTLETYTLLVLQGHADLARIRKSFSEKVINHPEDLYAKLKCKVVKKFGFYCWENITSCSKPFDINEHIRMVQQSDEQFWTEDALTQTLAQMYSRPLSIDKPRWELVIFPKFLYTASANSCDMGDPQYAFIFRTHHSIMDGISTYLMLSHTLADYPVETAINPLKPMPGSSTLWTVLLHLKLLLCWPNLLYENLGMEGEANCFHGPELTSKKIVTWTNPIGFSSIKEIRMREKCSTVAVFNAAVGGAFRQLAEKQGRQIPERITAVTSIPMLPYPDLGPRNRFSGAFFPLELGKSRAGRLKSTESTLRNITSGSPLILMNSLLLRFIGILPAKMSSNMTDSRELTVLTSNVPGPVKEIYFFGGDKTVDIGGWLPIKNKTGFGLCLVSYCGQVRVSFVTDEAVCSKQALETLAQEFENEISQMQRSNLQIEDWV